MPTWRDEYLSALQKRDQKEKANAAVYESCNNVKTMCLTNFTDYDEDTHLADRTATLQAVSIAGVVKPQDESTSSPKPIDRRANRDKGLPSSLVPEDVIAKVRQDLGEAQRSRGLMETRLHNVTEELNKLKIQSSLDTKRISDLTKEKGTLATGMRDRDEELRGKTKLIEVRPYELLFRPNAVAKVFTGCA